MNDFNNLPIEQKLRFIVANNKQLLEDNTELIAILNALKKEHDATKKESIDLKNELDKLKSNKKISYNNSALTQLFLAFLAKHNLRPQFEEYARSKHKQYSYE